MKRVCMCCGEPIPDEGNTLSRNPNICASCSSLADGMDETGLPEPSRDGASQPAKNAETQPEPAPVVMQIQ